MITVVVIKNPFDIRNRDIRQVKYSAVKTITGYINDTKIQDEVKISLNGKLIDENKYSDVIPQDKSNIVMCPVIGHHGGSGKNILGVVASIALAVATTGIGSAVSGGAWIGAGVKAMAGWTFAGYMAAAAVMYLGGTLLNHINSSVDANNSNYSTSTTYSWSTPKTQATQGSPMPITFGTMKISNNNVLSAHVTSDGDKQYLNLLVCGGEGPVDSISDIQIEDNPIANYDNIQIETRLGTNEQAKIDIPSFADNFSDQSLNYELTVGQWKTQLVDGNANQGLEVTFDFSNGLYYANDQGGLSSTGVTLGMQYRLYGSNGDWNNIVNNQYISAASNSAVIRSFRISGLAAGQYEVRCSMIGKDGSGSRYGNRCWWTQVSGIIPETFRYPNMVLVAIKALATSQLSGTSPAITWIQSRNNIWAYNPNTLAYEQKPANNPAWACYDILHMCRHIYDERSAVWVFEVLGAPVECIIYNDFIEWAKACDERGMVCNYFLDSAGDLDSAWKPFEAAGRGKVVRRGTKYGCIHDCVKEPVQMFTMGNIDLSTFSLDYLPLEDRANAVEITFNNQNKNYERDTLICYDDDYDNDNSTNDPTQINLDAVTNPDLVYREGKYYLRKNKYLVRTATWQSDIDAIASQVGDCVLLQHDVTEWGLGGRIVSTPNLSTVIIDRDIIMTENKNYEITIRMFDDTLVKRTVNTVLGTTRKITLSEPLPFLAKEFDIYSFGETEISAKPFTIQKLTKTSDSKVTIEALEYNKYVYSEANDVPDINYSYANHLAAILSISLGQETYLQKDGTNTSNIYISWTSERTSMVQSANIYTSVDDGNTWSLIGKTSGYNYTIYGVKTLTNYTIKIVNTNELGVQGTPLEKSVYITGKDLPPSDVEDFNILQTGDILVALITEVKDYDINYYELREGTTWEKSSLIGTFTGNKYSFNATDEGTITYFIKAVDNSGNYSLNAAKSICNITNLPERNVIFTENIPQEEWVTQSMWKGADGYYRIEGRKKLKDFVKFADIFTEAYLLKDDAQILLPVIDLGPNMIDESSFWKDENGKMHIRYTKTLKDFTKFADIFNSQLEYMKVKYRNSTFISVDVDGYADGNAKYTVEYRTSIDNTTWSQWIPESIKQFAGRYIQIRIVPQSLDSIGNMLIKAVSVIIDVPDITEVQENIEIPAGTAKTVSFSHTFEEIKSISAYTEDSGGKQATCELTNKTMKSVDVAILNDTDNRIAGMIQKLEIRGF